MGKRRKYKQKNGMINVARNIKINGMVMIKEYVLFGYRIQACQKYHIHDALKALSKNENVEKSINELYNYVSNEERALCVSTAFRKIILSNSKIAAAIIGLMLGEIKSENREFNNEDIILFNALESMTDFDIRNLKEIMEKQVMVKDNEGEQYFDETKFPEDKKKEYIETLMFCEKYRLFSSASTIFVGEALKMGIFYQPRSVAITLLEYINKIKGILYYGL